jgi:acyl-coenzyme A synthetase/AMP-(fatty) acid ligase
MTGSHSAGDEDWSRAGWRTHLGGAADVEDNLARLGDQSIPALAAVAAERAPGRVAVSVDGVALTHAELGEQATRVAVWLAGRIRPGDRVLLAAGSSIGFVRCYLGALRAGAVVVLANPAYTAAELGHLVADSGAVLAFADAGPARQLAGLAQTSRSCPVLACGQAKAGRMGASCPGWTTSRCLPIPRAQPASPRVSR